MNLFDPIFFHAAMAPRKPAIAAKNGLATYRFLADAVNTAAANIMSLGFHAGDRVALQLRDPFLHLTVILAVGRLGMASVSLTTDSQIDLSALGISGYFVDVTAPRPDYARVCVIDDGFFKQSRTSLSWANSIKGYQSAPDALCRIVLSSGSTGRPKAIGFTNGLLERRLDRFYSYAGEGRGRRSLSMMGLSVAFGFNHALRMLRHGGLVCFGHGPEEALDMAAFFQLEELRVSAHQLEGLVAAQRQNSRPLPSLSGIIVGGGKAARDTLIGAERTLCNEIVINYASTEAGTIASGLTSVLGRIDGAVGYILPDFTVQIFDADNRLCGVEEEGRIRIQSEAEFARYLIPDPSVESAFDRGWYHPGDLGLIRSDGILVITGRTGFRINRGGMKVAPEVIEEVLARHPDVADCAVLGMETRDGRTVILAAVVPKGAFAPEALRAFCHEHISAQTPDEFLATNIIPRSAIGKIERETLRGIVMTLYVEQNLSSIGPDDQGSAE